jgi:hypothetical protein
MYRKSDDEVHRQASKNMATWSPVAAERFRLATNFPLKVTELAFWGEDAVPLKQIYPLQQATAQNTDVRITFVRLVGLTPHFKFSERGGPKITKFSGINFQRVVRQPETSVVL